MINSIMKKNNLDAVIVSDPYNMRKLSGFSGGEGFVYISGKKSVFWACPMAHRGSCSSAQTGS